MVRLGIVGGTGYTGVELLRLLAQHPHAQVEVITSRAENGRSVAELYPNLRGHYELCFSEPDEKQLLQCDLVFFATPHGVAQSMMKALIDGGARVVDLSADFRIRDIELWEKWYGQAHACPDLVKMAVYGLPELNRDKIASARLVACPGCYPTSVLLALKPLLQNELIDPSSVVASCASGVSGAGRQLKLGNLLAEASDSFCAYAVSGHRHLPEIEQVMQDMMPVSEEKPQLTFVPHLLPVIRGMHSTVYTKMRGEVDLQALYEEHYQDEAFVDVLPAGSYPQTRTVRGSNMCRLAVQEPMQRGTAVLMSVIDNLAKGASAQGIQNMNIMLGLPEDTGLQSAALLP